MDTQQQEARAYEAAGYDRFEGFDRGDADWDYEAEQLANNEALEAELRADGLL
jgi:hypothetical protein